MASTPITPKPPALVAPNAAAAQTAATEAPQTPWMHGLMQINPNTFKELQEKHPELQGKDLSDPYTNILAAGYFMADLKDKFGSWELALRAYNSGENGVDRNNPNATPAGTGDPTYIPKVMEFADTIKQGGELPA
ncbi:MAG: transglycosylase SLT domain-containing protein [Noviherbaspirillum sp.]